MKGKAAVLIVEDDPNTAELLQFYVQWAGYEALRAKDGRTALEMIRKDPPALVVADIMLPEVHGIAVCHELKSDPKTKKIPVIIISVKNFPADRKQVEEAGADHFMPKPLEEKDFVAALEKFLGKGGPRKG